jgi:lipoate-protein ligase A
MRAILNTGTDPHLNLAIEEYLFKQSSEEIFLVWRNSPCLVFGKHQNPYQEINTAAAREKNVPVLRRISGGGTVFHDPGNINFTFMLNSQPGHQVNFPAYIQPVLDFLLSRKISAERNERNDLLIEGRKISGNAEHVSGNRVLHHGTLLYDTDLNLLSELLKVSPKNIVTNAVRSVRSHVTNIRPFHPESTDSGQFAEDLFGFLLNHFYPVTIAPVTESELAGSEVLVREKYKTWEWNYSYSPPFRISVKPIINRQEKNLALDVKNGMIVSVESEQEEKLLHDLLTGEQYRYETIIPRLITAGISPETAISLF